ncbi:MAG: alpha/beta fold hydrolase [Nocardioides sp.]|uniref:alpha/beta fold hydrolase n=1 Tax=Nocardioides sp. TaxID=35761 RepID=UPI0039E58F8D
MAYAMAGDGARLWFSARPGSEDAGLPVVLVAGLALDHHGWDSAVADFGERTVIVFDHRGTGESDDLFPEAWSTRDFARDVLAVLDAAGVTRAHVYGHSMGGRIAQWLGAEHADRVASLTLGATTVGGPGSIPRPTHASEALTTGGAALTALFYPDAWIAEHATEAGSVMPAPTSPEAMRHHLAAVALHDGPALSAITVPTLVIHGDEDQLAVPENAELLAQSIPDARLVLLSGARHAYWAGNPDAHQQVRAFLAEHDPTAT